MSICEYSELDWAREYMAKHYADRTWNLEASYWNGYSKPRLTIFAKGSDKVCKGFDGDNWEDIIEKLNAYEDRT